MPSIRQAIQKLQLLDYQIQYHKYTKNLIGFIDVNSLFLAFTKTKKLTTKYRNIVLSDIEGHFGRLVEQIQTGKYKPKPVFEREIWGGKKPKKKKSITIAKCNANDKVLQKLIQIFLNIIYESDFLENSYTYQREKGVIPCTNDLHLILNTHSWNTVIKLDIKQFFKSIDHDQLLTILSTRIRDQRFLNLISSILKTKVFDINRSGSINTSGVIQGSVIGPILSNIFLHFIFDLWASQKRESSFLRYADDILVFCHNRADALQLRTQISNQLNKYKLPLNIKKSIIIDLDDQQTFVFLGKTFNVTKGGVTMSK